VLTSKNKMFYVLHIQTETLINRSTNIPYNLKEKAASISSGFYIL